MFLRKELKRSVLPQSTKPYNSLKKLSVGFLLPVLSLSEVQVGLLVLMARHAFQTECMSYLVFCYHGSLAYPSPSSPAIATPKHSALQPLSCWLYKRSCSLFLHVMVQHTYGHANTCSSLNFSSLNMGWPEPSNIHISGSEISFSRAFFPVFSGNTLSETSCTYFWYQDVMATYILMWSFLSLQFPICKRNSCAIMVNLEQTASYLWSHYPRESYWNHHFTMFICYCISRKLSLFCHRWDLLFVLAFNIHTVFNGIYLFNSQIINLILICYN